MSEWISVKESMPEDNTYALVACVGGNVAVSFHCKSKPFLAGKDGRTSYSRKNNGKESGFFQLSHDYGYTITHWMPLPSPPEPEQ